MRLHLLHLLHLLAAHHGELQFGSPVVPKTPEGWALQYVHNHDAKLEMLAPGCQSYKPLVPRIQERIWPRGVSSRTWKIRHS